VLSRGTAEVVGSIRHRRQASGLEQIVIWQDGDKNLHVKIKKNGVWSPEGTELDMTFNASTEWSLGESKARFYVTGNPLAGVQRRR